MGFFHKAAKNRNFSNFSLLVQKISKHFYLLFLKIPLKIEFLYFLNNKKKKTLVGSFHKAKNRSFQKGLAHDFCQKFKTFHCLIFD